MKKILLGLVMGVMVFGGSLVAVPANDVLADIGNVCEDDNISDDLKEAAGCTVAEDKTAMPLAVNLINVVLSLVGVIAAGMIVYGAITYIISTGDAVKLQRAKNAILYGVIGFVVALLSYAVVTFVSKSIWS